MGFHSKARKAASSSPHSACTAHTTHSTQRGTATTTEGRSSRQTSQLQEPLGVWLGTIAHSFLPSHIATKHTRPKAQLRRAHGLRPADADARVAPMPWQLRPAAPPGASSGVRRRPDRRGRSPGCSSDPPPNAPKSQNAAQGSRPAGAPASPPRPASRVPPPPRCPPAIRRRSDRRSRSLGCSAAANARVCARAWT